MENDRAIRLVIRQLWRPTLRPRPKSTTLIGRPPKKDSREYREKSAERFKAVGGIIDRDPKKFRDVDGDFFWENEAYKAGYRVRKHRKEEADGSDGPQEGS